MGSEREPHHGFDTRTANPREREERPLERGERDNIQEELLRNLRTEEEREEDRRENREAERAQGIGDSDVSYLQRISKERIDEEEAILLGEVKRLLDEDPGVQDSAYRQALEEIRNNPRAYARERISRREENQGRPREIEIREREERRSYHSIKRLDERATNVYVRRRYPNLLGPKAWKRIPAFNALANHNKGIIEETVSDSADTYEGRRTISRRIRRQIDYIQGVVFAVSQDEEIPENKVNRGDDKTEASVKYKQGKEFFNTEDQDGKAKEYEEKNKKETIEALRDMVEDMRLATKDLMNREDSRGVWERFKHGVSDIGARAWAGFFGFISLLGGLIGTAYSISKGGLAGAVGVIGEGMKQVGKGVVSLAKAFLTGDIGAILSSISRYPLVFLFLFVLALYLGLKLYEALK